MESWVFSQVKAVEGVRGWRRKAQVAGVLGGQMVAASAVPWPRHGASGRFGGCWEGEDGLRIGDVGGRIPL